MLAPTSARTAFGPPTTTQTLDDTQETSLRKCDHSPTLTRPPNLDLTNTIQSLRAESSLAAAYLLESINAPREYNCSEPGNRHGRATAPTCPDMTIYDETGSRLYTLIAGSDAYQVARADLKSIQENGDKIVSLLLKHGVSALAGLGIGDGEKEQALASLYLKKAHPTEPLHIFGLDFSKGALAQSQERFSGAQFKFSGFEGNFTHCIFQMNRQRCSEVKTTPTPTALIFSGSTIGNFETREEATQLLKDLYSEIMPGDILVVAADMCQVKVIQEAAYNSPEETAFLQHLLNKLSDQLETYFDPKKFTCSATYDVEQNRVNSFLTAKEDFTVRINKFEGASISFKTGDRIYSLDSLKFNEAELNDMATNAGFRNLGLFKTQEGHPFGHMVLLKPNESSTALDTTGSSATSQSSDGEPIMLSNGKYSPPLK